MAAAARARPLLLLAPAVLASSRWPAFDALALLQAPAPREAARQPPAWQGQLMRVGTERRALGGNVPQFLLCQTEVGDPCDATAPVRWFSDFFGVIDGQMRELAGAGRTPAIMHIGANDFGDDAASYRALFGALSSGRGSFRVVLVEPDSKTAGQLRSTVLDRLGLPQGSVQVVEAAIKADCSESMNMYAFSDQMFEDFIRSPIERFCVRSSMQSWRSFDKMQPLRALKGVATQPMMDQTNLDAAGGAAGYDVFHKLIVPWAKRMLLAGNASAYVRRVPVRCLTPAGLLRETGVAPPELAALTIDAEGEDLGILHGLLESGVRPAFVQFEGGLSVSGAGVHDLQQRGYLVGRTQHAHSRDVVGVVRDVVPGVN